MKAAAALLAVVLLVVVASAPAQQQSSSPGKYGINFWWKSPIFTVHVINGLQPGSEALVVHCKSGDTDLGPVAPMVGEIYWRFRMNIFGTTLYFCNFWWIDHGQIHMNVFDKTMVSDHGRRNLYYTVTEDGITFRDDFAYDGLVRAWGPAAAGSPSV